MVAPSNVARLRASVESSFGADRTGTISNFFDIRSKGMLMPSASRAQLADDRLRQKVWEQTLNVQGFRSAAFDVAGHLTSHNLTLTNGTANTKDALSKVLEVICGGYVGSTGSLVASGATTTGFVLTGGNGATAGMDPGVCVFVETTAGSNIYQLNQVKTRVTDTLTFTHAFSFTPAVGAKVLGVQQIYPTSAPTGTTQWLFDSYDRNTILAMFGCQGDLKIDWTLGALAGWSSSMKAATYAYDSELATVQGGSALGAVTAVSYDGSTPIPVTAGGVVFSPSAGTLRTLPQVSKLECSLGLKWVQVDSFNAMSTGGIGAWVLVPESVTGTIQVPRDTIAYETARDAQTQYRIVAQAGSTAGKQLGLVFPNVQITDVKTVDRNGLQYMDLSWMALMNNDCTDQLTDLKAAPYYVIRG